MTLLKTSMRWLAPVVLLTASLALLGTARCGQAASTAGQQHKRRTPKPDKPQEPREPPSAPKDPPVKMLKTGGARLDWCAENNLIAFDIKGSNGDFEVHVMKPDGSDEHCVSCNVPGLPKRHVGQPAWHPSGRYLVVQAEKQEHEKVRFDFVLNPGAGVLNDLWLIDVENNRAHLLRAVGNGTDQGTLHAHFSHDGKKLSWSEMYDKGGWKKNKELGYWKLMVADFSFEGGEPKLDHIRSFTPSGDGFYENHGFSPDGTRLIYTSNAGAKRFSNDIFVMDLSSGKEKKLTNGGHNEHAIFSPDGKHIVWMSNEGNDNRGTDYWMMNADGSGKQRLTFFNQKGHSDYVGRRMIVADLTWSPDGKSIAAYRRVGNGVVPDKEDAEIVTVDVSAEVAPPRR